MRRGRPSDPRQRCPASLGRGRSCHLASWGAPSLRFCSFPGGRSGSCRRRWLIWGH
uniref:Uncharacterized protein n=1 Tax=Setaria viridis TaxID=4556 RepID=A0A4U6VVN4_SETVI|nr:hypothetical protein SEVIR_2G195050v2 [Setaria viridis]